MAQAVEEAVETLGDFSRKGRNMPTLDTFATMIVHVKGSGGIKVFAAAESASIVNGEVQETLPVLYSGTAIPDALAVISDILEAV